MIPKEHKEAIVLAGGLGTRLRGVIGEIPKCMAPVAGKPFLHYLFRYLAQQDISRIILSLGYLSEVVIDWLRREEWPFKIDWVVEDEPLGTGGGIQLAMQQCAAHDVFVLNGDTMFTISLQDLLAAHLQFDGEATIALKQMQHFDRYGTVKTDAHSRVFSFEEKTPTTVGYINGGIYLMSRERFLGRAMPVKFSFERDYLEAHVGEQQFYSYGVPAGTDAYFIDIGVPVDYAAAQKDVPTLFPS